MHESLPDRLARLRREQERSFLFSARLFAAGAGFIAGAAFLAFLFA